MEKKAAAAADYSSTDRISELPEPVLHHIFSFLTTKQIVQASVVSKTCLDAWNTFPVLHFVEPKLRYWEIKHDTAEKWRDYCRRKDLDRKRKAKLSIDLVERALLRRRKYMVSVKKLKLEIHPDFSPAIDRCVELAIKNNVEIMNLRGLPDIEGEPKSGPYLLPGIVLGATRLVDLKLDGSRLELPRSPNVINLSFLKKLFFCKVYADDELIRNIFRACPVIEDIMMVMCEGFTTVSVFNLPKLLKLSVQNFEFERLDVGPSSNLLQLSIYFASLRPFEINLACCKNLTSLSLIIGKLRDESLLNQISQLLSLEYLSLSLSRCKNVKKMKISNPSLKTLSICSVSDNRELNGVEISTPSLQNFYYSSNSIVPFSSNKLVLSELRLRFTEDDEINANWYHTLIQFLAKVSNSSTVVHFQSYTGTHFVVPKDLREILSPPLHNTKELGLMLRIFQNREGRRHEISELVDAMLWISPHLLNLSITLDTSFEPSFKIEFQFTYGKAFSEGDSSSCKSVPPPPFHCVKVHITVEKFSHDSIAIQKKEYCFDFEDDIFKMIKDCSDCDFLKP